MAKCDICEKDMLKVNGCKDRDYTIDGKTFKALPHIDRFGGEERCHDCNAKEGDLHHLGCDNERCPSCGGQFISCDCDVSDQIAVYNRKRSMKERMWY